MDLSYSHLIVPKEYMNFLMSVITIMKIKIYSSEA